MSDQPAQLSFEEACKTIFSAWYDGKDLAAGDRVANPKDAAARAVIAALNATDGAKGTIRILVQTAEQKRLTRNYLDAFLLDQPQLKPMVRKMAPELISLNGGISIAVDLNEARLTKSLVTIVLDTSAGAPIGSCWLNVDGDTIESKAACAVRHGFKVEDVPNLRFVRWMTSSEAKVAPKPAWDEITKPGPLVEPERRPGIEEQQAALEAKQQAAARQRETEEKYHAALERRKREDQAEKIADHFSRIRQRGV